MIRLLLPQLQRFAWGSPTAIPEILGLDVDGSPLAEAWFGATSRVAPGPVVDLTDGADPASWPSLEELVAHRPCEALGEGPAAVEEDGHPRFPFLVKFLAAAWPLSIQVHPNATQAREGFEREQAAGIAPDDPARIYRDPNAKPEAIVALEPFQLLAGFRDPLRSAELLEALDCPALGEVVSRLRRGGPAGVEGALRYLCNLDEAPLNAVVAELTDACGAAAEAPDGPAGWAALQCRWVAQLGNEFPGDPGVVFALLMNHLELDEFDLAFVPEGMVHSYLVGSGLEVMGNSDNVVRGGLTIKPTHLDELLRIVDFTPALPTLIRAGSRPAGPYEIPSQAFALDVIDVRSDDAAHHAAAGPEIIVTLDGAVHATHGAEADTASGATTVSLSRGAAAFVAADTGQYRVAGEGRIARITLPG